MVESESDGLVSYEELLAWFLDVGRSYLPKPVYKSVQELEHPTPEELRVLFDTMDEDASGDVGEAEVKHTTMLLYPFLDEDLLHIAFEAADGDGDGIVAFETFDELMKFLQFLNKQRHSIEEMMDQFADGVDLNDFYMGLGAMGIACTDKQAKDFFDMECVRLQKQGLTAREYLIWVCRHECVEVSNEEQEQERLAMAAEELQSHMGDYG